MVSVAVKQDMQMSKIFAKTYVQGSTVDRVGTVWMVSVTVEQVMSMLKTFVRKHVNLVPVRN